MTDSNSEALANTDTDLGAAFTLAPVAMAVFDHTGIQRANRKFRDLLESLEKVHGSGDARQLFTAQIRNFILQATPEQSTCALALTDRNGQTRSLNVHLQPLVADASGPVLLTVQDWPGQDWPGGAGETTDPEAELERFFYLASHDLQEPLRKIVAFSQTLKRRLHNSLTDKDAIFELDRLDNAARRMSDMLQGLLELSRYAQSTMQLRQHSLAELVERTLTATGREHRDRNHTITLSKDGRMQVDLAAMMIVFEQIINNSIVYAAPGEHVQIDIRCDQGQDWTEIAITDNGPGVAQKQLQEIFDPFSRFCAKSIPGNGIGLALCRKIVMRHGGQIQAEIPRAPASQSLPGLKVVIRIPSRHAEHVIGF